MMTSLDGFFELPDHGIDWHNVDDEFVTFALEQLSKVGTILFGRKTYDLMAGYWPSLEAISSDPITARYMTKLPKIVVSHEPFTPEWENTTVVTVDIVNYVQDLKNQEGDDIAMFGSNNLCVSLMPSRLIDEFRIMINPVALGKGNSLFTGLNDREKFKLKKIREFTSGNVLLNYIPA